MNETKTNESRPPKKTAIIIYRPQDRSDPPEQKFGGLIFRANEPVEVPYSHTIEQLISEKIETFDGKIARQHKEVLTPLPEVLRHNPWFEVDGVKEERVRPEQRTPEDADGYRGYAINWISVSMSADTMDKRWNGEDGLRQRCGVSPADISYLLPFFQARRLECAELDRQRGDRAFSA